MEEFKCSVKSEATEIYFHSVGTFLSPRIAVRQFIKHYYYYYYYWQNTTVHIHLMCKLGLVFWLSVVKSELDLLDLLNTARSVSSIFSECENDSLPVLFFGNLSSNDEAYI